MNDFQIKNWRRVLYIMIGPYAFLMPKEDIIALRDKFQQELSKSQSETQVDAFCTCDPQRHGKTVHMDGTITCNKCQKKRQ